MSQGQRARRTLLMLTAVLSFAGLAQAQNTDFATGNMHFDAKEMDTNGDHMVSREEMLAYAEKSWDMMAHGKDTISVSAATEDFASGGVNFKARAIDADHDGSISKQEYIAWLTRKFETMKKTDNMVSVADMARAFGQGNVSPHAPKADTPK